MRNIILIFACILELVFGLYCIISKSNRVFQGYMCVVISFVLLIFTVWLLLFPRYELPKTTGEYEVGTKSDIYIDDSRVETYRNDGAKRSLQIKFWYPENMGRQGESPLIVFSHGGYGVKESNESLFYELASHGYVVCSMDHTYQCFSTRDINGEKISIDKGFLKETMNQDASKKKESYEYFQKWMDIRTGDINFVLNTVLSKVNAKDEEEVFKLINPKKIGLVGHSLGGSAVLGVGRVREDVGAVIALESPFMCDIVGVENDEFVWNEEKYPTPILNVYTDSSWENLSKWPQYAANYKLIKEPSKDSEYVYLKGAGHFTLTDLALSCPMLCVVNGQKITLDGKKSIVKLNESCLEFLNSYLKE